MGDLILPPVLLLEKEVASVTETYSAGEEKTKFSIGSRGYLTLVHDGNGDPTLTTRIYVGGVLKESCPCNVRAIFHITFEESLGVKVYSEVEQVAKSSSLSIHGVEVVCL